MWLVIIAAVLHSHSFLSSTMYKRKIHNHEIVHIRTIDTAIKLNEQVAEICHSIMYKFEHNKPWLKLS